jgi:uncharacterized protein
VPFPLTDLIVLIALGLAAGSLGGLLGIGGSIVMIPVLTLILDRNQHLSQAAAMIVNFFISLPAFFQHRRAGAVDWAVIVRMTPAGLVFIVIGVEASNLLDGRSLMRFFGVFLLYVIFVNVRRLIVVSRRGPRDVEVPKVTWPRASLVGTITGFAAGLLGIGGGIIAVPLLQRACHLPLRKCIGASATVMCATAVLGAVRKNLTLSEVTDAAGGAVDPLESLVIAACLAPTAILGGHFGAGLTHSLPLKWVRIAFIVLLCFAAAKFLGLY